MKALVYGSAVVISAIAALMLGCSPQRLSGGSEIGNPSQITLVGTAAYSGTSAVASGALVRLRSKLYTQDTSQASGLAKGRIKDTRTDSLGRFVLDSVDTGAYCIEIDDGKADGALVQCDVSTVSGPLITLPVTLVKPTAVITGTVPVALSSLSGAIYVQVYGIDRVVRADPATGMFTIKDVPEGAYTLRVLSSSTDFLAMDVDNVAVWSGGATDIGPVRLFAYQAWAHCRKIILNTAQSGAQVSGTVTGFPVCVRLTESIFDFSACAPGGTDIRFAKSDSAPLPFEIGLWDATAKRAEIWVKADTVRGGDSSQSILMFYGNPQAASASRGSGVFGGNAGFIAVWHLNGNCGDATGNHFDGANYGSVDTTGIMGGAKKFSGHDSIRIDGLMGQPATLTLSGWAKTDTTVTVGGQEVVSIGDAVLLRVDEVGVYGTGGYAHRYTKSGDTAFTKVTTGQTIAKSGWRYVAFTFNNDTHTHTLYIDGEAIRVDTSAYSIDYSGVGANTFIGMHGNGKLSYAMRGMIDEVRVCGVARSADWIKLCYMNQRMDDKLVAFK